MPGNPAKGGALRDYIACSVRFSTRAARRDQSALHRRQLWIVINAPGFGDTPP